MLDKQSDAPNSPAPGGTGFQPVRNINSAVCSSFQPVHCEQITRRNLPHIQIPGLTYHVVFRTRNLQLAPAARQIALDACLFWNGSKCIVHACVAMPDHVHILLTPCQMPDSSTYFSLAELLHSIKRHSASLINKLLKRTGRLWQDESYDRYTRSDSDFEEKYQYIASNPVKDGLATTPGAYPYLYLQWPNEV